MNLLLDYEKFTKEPNVNEVQCGLSKSKEHELKMEAVGFIELMCNK